jgi:hypothetical protein
MQSVNLIALKERISDRREICFIRNNLTNRTIVNHFYFLENKSPQRGGPTRKGGRIVCLIPGREVITVFCFQASCRVGSAVAGTAPMIMALGAGAHLLSWGLKLTDYTSSLTKAALQHPML